MDDGEVLKVAHVCLGRVNPEASDGMDKTIYYLSRAQADLGHSVRVFSITNKPPLPIRGVTVSTYQSLKPSRLLFNRRLQDLLCWRSPLNLPKALVADLLAWHPDIVHLHGVHMLQHLVLSSRIRRAAIPYCVSIHGMLSGAARRRHRLSKSLAAIWERPMLRGAAFLHALNEQEERDLREYGGAARIVIARNGIDTAALQPVNADQLPHVTENALTFLFLGRLDPEQKGLDILLEAWSDARLGDATRLLLVGPSWRDSQPRLAALAKRLGVDSQVVFTGPASGQNKVDLLRRSSVFVLTSRWEGLAFSVLEAAALGKPCLLTSAADPLGRFGATGAGVIVEPTRSAIADGLRRFAQMDVTERDAMGRRARDLVEAEFTWAPVARTLIAAYRDSAAGS
jgi:glycosyltransferase involved in cell wall biosynthesis